MRSESRGFTSTAFCKDAVVRELSSSAKANLQEGLAGSGPLHKSCIFLHHPDPPSKYPPKVTSELWRALTLRAVQHRGLVNFCWRSDGDFVAGNSGEPESYPATVFLAGDHSDSKRRIFRIPTVTLENLDVVDALLSLRDGEQVLGAFDSEESAQEQHIYVCTHGARDCRCGDTGGAVVAALREEVASRIRSAQARSAPNAKSPSIWDKLKIGEVAHVGGHKYAANVLLYPGGEWLGKILPSDVPALLDLVGSGGLEEAQHQYPFVLAHSRGRMGVDKEAHRQLFEQLAEIQE